VVVIPQGQSASGASAPPGSECGAAPSRREHAALRLFADLEALRAEAKQDDWAGREGKAIQPESYLLARAILESLIPYFETPELNVDRDGAVVLDWARDREHMLSLTAEPDGRLIYAFRAGPSSGSRTERFQGVIPPALAADLAEVTQICR